MVRGQHRHLRRQVCLPHLAGAANAKPSHTEIQLFSCVSVQWELLRSRRTQRMQHGMINNGGMMMNYLSSEITFTQSRFVRLSDCQIVSSLALPGRSRSRSSFGPSDRSEIPNLMSPNPQALNLTL